jgi:hypothetical protein
MGENLACHRFGLVVKGLDRMFEVVGSIFSSIVNKQKKNE